MSIKRIRKFKEMSNYDVLWKGKWVEVISPKGENMEYEALHDKRPIALGIPYLADIKKYIIRKEHCPPYTYHEQISRRYFTLLSGGIEEGEEPLEAYLREIEEESGIRPIEYEIVEEQLDTPLMKVATTRSNFYILKINSYERVDAIGDGTLTEELSESIEVDFQELYDILHTKDNIDFLLYGAYHVILERRKQMEEIE